MGPRSCCGCFSLRSGAIAIGITLVTLSSMLTVTVLALIIYLVVYGAPQLEILGPMLALSVLHLVFSSLLVHGARHGRRVMVLAWLIHSAIVAILQSMAVVIGAVLVAKLGEGMGVVIGLVTITTSGHSVLLWATLAGLAVWTAVLWYFFAVVLSFSLELHQHAEKVLSDCGGCRKSNTQVV